jgi:virginiamycin B lyase
VKRSENDWRIAIQRMLGYAGPDTGFPVISNHAHADTLAKWLHAHLPERARLARAARPPAISDVEEFMMPVAGDLPHDVAIARDGRILITGMFTHRMYVLDPASGVMAEVEIPVPQANPRAVEVGADGQWWVLLGNPAVLAAYDPAGRSWRTFDVGVYPHSVALDGSGGAWYNGHFTRDPSVIGRVDRASGDIVTYDMPLHPELAKKPGGPIPYEVRAAPDGAIWISELQGNRVLRFVPATKQFTTYVMPTSHAAPRRLDIDANGIVWIPEYGAGRLARLDPATGSIREIELPIRDAAPYVVRVDDARNRVWIGAGSADAVFEFDPVKQTFRTHPLPSAGAMVRHMAVDARTGDVWLAYGASPGIAARVARLAPR